MDASARRRTTVARNHGRPPGGHPEGGPVNPREIVARLLLFVVLVPTLAVAETGPDPGKGAAAKLNVYFARDFTDTAYQKAAFERVARYWKPAAPPAPGKKAVVIATIARDGRLADAYLNLTSGSKAWDAAALDALKRASPFPALPKSFPRETVEIHWHFEFGR